MREKLIEVLDRIQTYGLALWENPSLIVRNEEIADSIIAEGLVGAKYSTPTMQAWRTAYDPPKRLVPVICLYKNEDGTQVGGGYVNDFGVWTLIAPAKGIITHWMPLTELPKGESVQ